MKISTRGRYGLRAIIDVAFYGTDTCVTTKNIAERNGLSEGYLEKLLSALKSAGFVKSVRGAQGGYALGRPAAEISVGDILRALEGPMYPVDCLSSEDKHARGTGAVCGTDCSLCVAKPVWEKIYNRLNDVMESISLADLVSDYTELQGSVINE
ncbi:MAG: Rrf2 family transcriptional regulator [Clostridiales bacterium]|nr:Rrf2 family transcriptional regulator [Clostridiales bacterium]